MAIHSKGIKRALLLGLVMVVVAACVSERLDGVTVSPSTAAPTATGRPSSSPLPTVTPAPTSTSTSLPSPTPTSTPTPTATPDPAAICQVPGEDGRIFVISNEALQEHHPRLETLEALREAIRKEYPGWAEYSQELTFGKMVVTYDLARILVNAGFPCLEGPCPYQISVNPQVILTVMAMRYGDEPPPGFDAWQTAGRIALDIKRLYEESQNRPEAWQGRFANAGSFVMYKVLEQREDQLQVWCVAYHTFYALTR